MAPESLQAMMSMATQLEQMGLTPGMQGGTGTLPFLLVIADEWRRFTRTSSKNQKNLWHPALVSLDLLKKRAHKSCTWLPAFAGLRVGICLD